MLDRYTDPSLREPGLFPPPGTVDCHVLVMADWNHLPYALCASGNGIRAELLNSDAQHRAQAELKKPDRTIDAIVIDEDFFGCLEDTAEFCLRMRRFDGALRILTLASEMSDSTGILAEMGLCDATLPAHPTPDSLIAALVGEAAAGRHALR